MQKIHYKNANIVDALLIRKEIDVLIQGCNCFCGFGRGLAEEIKNRIPSALEADEQTIPGDINKLGDYSHCLVDGKLVVNAYTQYHYIARRNNEPKVKNGRGYILADYLAIKKALTKIKNDFGDKKYGLPLIGAGWANGDWTHIESIIKDVFSTKEVTIYYIDKDEARLKELGCI